jgi:uncharacterized membrane protein YfcA
MVKSKSGPVAKTKVKMTAQVILILIVIGLFAGMLSGMVGVGGGIIVVPALVYFLSFSQHEAQGTSLGLLLLPVGILAVLNYYHKGYIDIKVVAFMCLGFIIGGFLGSKMSLALPEATVKKVFGLILLYTSFKMMGWDAAIIRFIKSIF